MDEVKIITTSDGSHSLINISLDETYHSRHGALQESIHVFIKNGFDYYRSKHQPDVIRILEIGFGTGLNTLLTLEAAVLANAQVHYTAIEPFPVGPDLIRELNYPNLIDFPQSQELFHKIHTVEWNTSVLIADNFSLEKQHIKFQQATLPANHFDLVYFDAFAPNKQPAMWEITVFKKVYDSMHPGSALVTYCAKGQVKRDLKSLGFAVEALPGPPQKREMLRATYADL